MSMKSMKLMWSSEREKKILNPAKDHWHFTITAKGDYPWSAYLIDNAALVRIVAIVTHAWY